MPVCKAPLQRSSWRGVPTGGVRQRLYLKGYNKF